MGCRALADPGGGGIGHEVDIVKVHEMKRKLGTLARVNKEGRNETETKTSNKEGESWPGKEERVLFVIGDGGVRGGGDEGGEG